MTYMDKSHLEWIAEKIDKLYKEKGFTLESLAGATCDLHTENPQKYNSCTRTALINIKNCVTNNPRPKTLASIAHALGLPDDYFLPTMRKLNEREIYQQAMDYLLNTQYELDQPLDDAINEWLSDNYHTDPQPLIGYFHFRGYEIEYDVIDNAILRKTQETLVDKKKKSKPKPANTRKYEERIAKLQIELENIPVPNDYDTDSSTQDRYYELQADLHDVISQFEDYKRKTSPVPSEPEIHYAAKMTIINNFLASGVPLNDVPLIARINRPDIMDEHKNRISQPPVEMTIHRFVEATKQVRNLIDFLLEL